MKSCQGSLDAGSAIGEVSRGIASLRRWPEGVMTKWVMPSVSGFSSKASASFSSPILEDAGTDGTEAVTGEVAGGFPAVYVMSQGVWDSGRATCIRRLANGTPSRAGNCCDKLRKEAVRDQTQHTILGQKFCARAPDRCTRGFRQRRSYIGESRRCIWSFFPCTACT